MIMIYTGALPGQGPQLHMIMIYTGALPGQGPQA